MPERLVCISKDLTELAHRKANEIQDVTRSTKILATNALIEAAHAGEVGRGFAIVAQEVSDVSEKVKSVTESLKDSMKSKMVEVDQLAKILVVDVVGTRLADLSHGIIEIIDRNLYERSCDVRWWATDSAVVDAVTRPDSEVLQHTAQRLGVILDAYTVYLDIWVADEHGQVLANGRPDKFPQAIHSNVSSEPWFQKALHTSSGADFCVDDIAHNAVLDNRLVATYSTAIREGGDVAGRVLGVVGIFFDWQTQSHAVVDGVRLNADEKSRSRCLLLDARHQVIAASDKQGILQEKIELPVDRDKAGFFLMPDGSICGYALTPGYETYQGLGWFGAIIQKRKQK